MDSLQRNCDKMVFKFCLCSHLQQKKRKSKAGLCNSMQSYNFSVIFKPLFATLQTKIILKRSFTFRGILDTCKTGQSILNVTSVDHGTECTRIYHLRTRATCRVSARAGNEPSRTEQAPTMSFAQLKKPNSTFTCNLACRKLCALRWVTLEDIHCD